MLFVLKKKVGRESDTLDTLFPVYSHYVFYSWGEKTCFMTRIQGGQMFLSIEHKNTDHLTKMTLSRRGKHIPLALIQNSKSVLRMVIVLCRVYAVHLYCSHCLLPKYDVLHAGLLDCCHFFGELVFKYFAHGITCITVESKLVPLTLVTISQLQAEGSRSHR